MQISFEIPGPPRTKKNSSRLDLRGVRPRKIPSKAFEEWNKQAQLHLMQVRRKWDVMPLECPVNCRATFYRDAFRGDAVGYYQALADALEEAGIVENDSLIVQWDGSRLKVDAVNPRIEGVLEIL